MKSDSDMAQIRPRWRDSLADLMRRQYWQCLQQPLLILLALAVLCGLAAYQLPTLRFDASSDSLIAQGDPELAFYNRVTGDFQEHGFLVLTYTPKHGPLFAAPEVARLATLTGELGAIEHVASVQSLLDAPLLQSPPVPLTQLADGYRTVQSPDVDLELARRELVTSPVFRDLLVSADGKTTAIRINLDAHEELAAVRRERDALRAQGRGEVPPALEKRYYALSEQAKRQDHQTIEAVRAIRDRHQDEATMYLGGVPMVAADMIEFIKRDMSTFALVVLALLAGALYAFFRRPRWVIFPLATSGVSILLTAGALAALGQPVSAISANLVALQAIITISFTVHLIARYRELHATYRDDHAQCRLAYETMTSKLAPSVYTAATTMVAFASLLTADIVPITDFGWMMCLAIGISLLVTYSFFASVLVLLPKDEPAVERDQAPLITVWLADLSTRHYRKVVAGAGLLLVVSALGIQQLELGSRIVEYFRSDTEIRQGLDFIDQHLGGTIPMDIVLQLDPYSALSENGDDMFDDFASDVPDAYPERFWFTPEKIALIDRLQTHVDSLPGVGKSMSLSNLERVARTFQDGEPLSYVALTAVLGKVPEDVRRNLIDPYASPSSGTLRISTRLHETGPEYQLGHIIESIHRYATESLHLPQGAVHVTGIAVLFDNMLEQLVRSQLSTLGFVVLATFTMFALLLRGLGLSVIGLVPNLLAAMVILAFMGYAGIHLDLMTITIAAIVIGIGVDDAIHYLHRYQEEINAGAVPMDAIHTTHRSIGKAMYFTTATVVAGLSVLVFSHFVPTIYFGSLAALAMVLALTANLTLLPALLVLTESPSRASIEEQP